MRLLVAVVLGVIGFQAHAWESHEALSPIDDAVIPSIHLAADAEYSTGLGKSGRAHLQLLCEQKRTVFAIVLPGLYMADSGGWGEATLRVDKKAARKQHFTAANDHGSLALIGAPAISTAKSLLGGKSLFARVLPVNEASIDLRFEIAGIDEAIRPIRAACQW